MSKKRNSKVWPVINTRLSDMEMYLRAIISNQEHAERQYEQHHCAGKSISREDALQMSRETLTKAEHERSAPYTEDVANWFRDHPAISAEAQARVQEQLADANLQSLHDVATIADQVRRIKELEMEIEQWHKAADATVGHAAFLLNRIIAG